MERIAELRRERGWSQVKLGAKADVNPSTVNQIERGMRHPNSTTLEKLAAALEVEVAELFSPKAQAPLQLEDQEAGHTERERLLSYLRSSERQIERMRARWEAAVEENTFSREAWSEAVEVVMDWDKAFVEAVPISVYATGAQWLPEEEWEAVATMLGSRSVLKGLLDKAYAAYESRFGEKGDQHNVEDLTPLLEKRRRLREGPEEFAEARRSADELRSFTETPGMQDDTLSAG